ncbi:MAG: hypothetical protein E7463_03240 [Ruminococcaceae bacterium]|nr:hypothetical protein [Oscillospiraceae bacterium]
MVKVIMGKKGTGKTKQIIEMVNTAASNEKNCVVCIEGGRKLTYDVSYAVRLVDVGDYPFAKGYDALFAFICGLYAHNFDVSHMFIDSLYKVAGDSDPVAAEKFVRELDAFSRKNEFDIIIMISDDTMNATDGMREFVPQA